MGILSPWPSAPPADALSNIPWVMRLHAERNGRPFGLYKDTACSQPATLAGDSIAAWRDEWSGKGLTMLQATAGSRPILALVAGKWVVRFDGVDDYLAVTGASFPLTNRTVAVRHRLFSSADTNDGVFGLSVPSGVDSSGANALLLSLAGGIGVGSYNVCPTVPTLVRSTQASGSALTYIAGALNKTQASDTQTGTATIFALGDRTLSGARGGFPTGIDVDAVLIGVSLTSGQTSAIDSALCNPAAPLIVCEGDSLTQGAFPAAGSVSTENHYPSQLQALRPNSLVINNGVYGNQIAALVSRASQCDGMFRAGARLIVFAGTNNLTGGGETAAAALAELATYVAARQAAGWDVWVATMIGRGDQASNQSNYNAQRALFNAGIASAYPTRTLNYAGNPLLGANGASANATIYQADLVHLTAAGHALNAATAHATLS